MMRKAVMVMALLGMFGIGSAGAQQQDTPKAGEMCLLKVSGMHCGACAATVERAAKKIDGVITAKADQPKGTAEIEFDPAKTSPNAIAKAISAQTPFKAEAPKRKPKR